MDEYDEFLGEVLDRRRALQTIGVPALTWLAGCSGGDSTPDGQTSADETGGGDPTATASPTTTSTASDTTPSEDGQATPTETSTKSEPATPTPAEDACIVKPALMEGPFYTDDEDNPNRSDVRTDTETGTVKDGVPLDLTFRIFGVETSGDDQCSPVNDAVVDIWQADAGGTYSDFESEGTLGQDFLRGHQFTDHTGTASFTTIYPGWYPGRTPIFTSSSGWLLRMPRRKRSLAF
jgi:protocatechuate 3,4-dioxygenase beta subunit